MQANKPAFPFTTSLQSMGSQTSLQNTPGLTKREYFAGRFMAEIIGTRAEGIHPDSVTGLAIDAIVLADALLTELEKGVSNA